MSGYYRQTSVQMWSDPKFRRLSKPQPNAQDLFHYIFTGSHTNTLPGLFGITCEELAIRKGWPADDTRTCLQECIDLGLVKYDAQAGVIFLPNFMKHVTHASVTNLKGWRAFYLLINESPLCLEWMDTVRLWHEQLPDEKDEDKKRKLNFNTVFGGLYGKLKESLDESSLVSCVESPDKEREGESERESEREFKKNKNPVAQNAPAGAAAELMDPTEKRARREGDAVRKVQGWTDQLEAYAVEMKAPGLVEMLVGEFAQQVETNMGRKGQSFTALRRAQFAERMAKSKPLHQLYGLEVFVDTCTASQDWRYACKVAEDKKHLTDAEFDKEHDSHRETNKIGFWSRYLVELRSRNGRTAQ